MLKLVSANEYTDNLNLPVVNYNISNRDFDFYYQHKQPLLLKKNPITNIVSNFIHNLYLSGFKCKQSSIAYKFYSFPIIKIYSYLSPNKNFNKEFVKHYKLFPDFSSINKDLIKFFINFFIINGEIFYGLKSIKTINSKHYIDYLYGEEADFVLNQISDDKNYNYLDTIKSLKLSYDIISQLKQNNISILTILSEDESIHIETNCNLEDYNFPYSELISRSNSLNFFNS